MLIGGGDIGRSNTKYETKEIDEKIESLFDIAKSEKYGYLTTVPTKVGTRFNCKSKATFTRTY